MSKFDSWFSAEIRAVYYQETRRGTTPRARNRASMLAQRERVREQQLRNQIHQELGLQPEDLLRERVTK